MSLRFRQSNGSLGEAQRAEAERTRKKRSRSSIPLYRRALKFSGETSPIGHLIMDPCRLFVRGIVRATRDFRELTSLALRSRTYSLLSIKTLNRYFRLSLRLTIRMLFRVIPQRFRERGRYAEDIEIFPIQFTVRYEERRSQRSSISSCIISEHWQLADYDRSPDRISYLADLMFLNSTFVCPQFASFVRIKRN